MKRNKNFFYRINPHEVLAEVLFSENKEQWFLQFFDDLRKDNPGTATIPLAARIIEEAHNFREKRSIAGRASAEQRGNKNQQDATYDEHMLKDVQPVAVAVAVAVSSKEESKHSSRPQKSGRAPSGDHQLFIAWWIYAYERVSKTKYVLSKADTKCVSDILKALPIKDAIAKAATLFISEDPFYQDKHKDITFLRSQINKLTKAGVDDIGRLRELGIAPPVGIKFEDWKFWESKNV